MDTMRKQAAFTGGVIAIVSGVAGIVSWWVPQSATWFNRHGFAAWPLAGICVILLIWTQLNLYGARRELQLLQASLTRLTPEDERLFHAFKSEFPKDSPALAWLRSRVDHRIYHSSDVRPLRAFLGAWRDQDWHFVNADLEQESIKLINAIEDLLSYQALHSELAPEHFQRNADDTAYQIYVYEELSASEEIIRGIGQRADRVLASHNSLYMTGSRLGL